MRDSRVRSLSPRCSRARLLRTCARRLLGPAARDRENAVAETSVRPPSPSDAAGQKCRTVSYTNPPPVHAHPRKTSSREMDIRGNGARLGAAMQQWLTGNPGSIIPARTIAAIVPSPPLQDQTVLGLPQRRAGRLPVMAAVRLCRQDAGLVRDLPDSPANAVPGVRSLPA
jgi:hypothetical protein